MKKGKKRLLAGVGILVVAAGAVAVVGKPGAQPQQPAQVPVLCAGRGDVEQVVDATGTVVSDEQKTYFSPVNAQVKSIHFKQGDTVSEGQKLLEFNLKDLQENNQKAELNVKSSDYDYQDAVNKSDRAQKKQSDAAANVEKLEKQVQEKKDYVASLKAQLSAVSAQAQADAAAAAQAETIRQQQEAAAQAEAARLAEEEKNREIQRAYSESLATYNSVTLPQYQRELGQLSSLASQALNAYNQAQTAYQMAFSNWEADQSEGNAQALSQADIDRSNAQAAYLQAQEQYENKKAQQPQMPALSDFTNQEEFVTDGTGTGFTDQTGTYSAQSVQTDSAQSSYQSPDTSGIENALEEASSDLAELQSELASEKAVAEADPAGMSSEEKEKMMISTNLTELEAKTAQELVEEGKKGLSSEFNGVVSKLDIVEGAAVSQGMELFTLQNIDKVSVDINVSKYDYDKVEEGQEAEITLGDKTYEGTVTRVSHMAVTNEKGTPMISASVKINNPDEDIFLGVDAKVKIFADKAQDVVTLPVEVINIGRDGSFCYVLEDGIITRRNLTTGLSSEDSVEVLEGIQDGEQVIADLGGLEEGMQAQPYDETGEAADE